MKPGKAKRMNKPTNIKQQLTPNAKQVQKGTKRAKHNLQAQAITSVSNQTHKNSGAHATNLPAFFQKNFGIKSENISMNTVPKLKTVHKSYYPSQSRMIIIGDIHGDLDRLIDCLVLSKCVKLPGPLPPQEARTNTAMYNFFNGIQWTGDKTFIIQLGDQIDRVRPDELDHNNIAITKAIEDEGSSLHIFYLLWHLNVLAYKHGGRVISIIGNHEFMNVNGDFRYVSHHEFKEYYDAFHRYYDSTTPEYDDHNLVDTIKKETATRTSIPPGYLERRIAFHPSGLIANFIGVNYKLCVQVGKWIFIHGGITTSLCNSSICSINNSISRHLIQGNQNTQSPMYNTNKVYDESKYNKLINSHDEDSSPVWNRDFGISEESDREERKLSGKYHLLMKEYNTVNKPYHAKNGIPPAEYMAIGHSPQFWHGKNINSICNGKVWRCDIGMSRAFKCDKEANTTDALKLRQPTVLEVINDTIINRLS